MAKLNTEERMDKSAIHPTAIVDSNARLDRDVKIGPYSIIGGDVEIGAGTTVGPHCVIERWTKIGRDCQIFTGAVLGGVTQDLKFKGERSFVKIGDRNRIREYVTINRSTAKDGATIIGNDNLIMAYSHIAHDCVICNKVIIANCGTLAGHCTMHDGSILGGLAGLHQFVQVGTLAIIGGCSKVVKHIPPYAMADGHPARVYGLNIIGLNRAGISSKAKMYLKRAFKILFNSGHALPRAFKEIKETIPSCKEIDDLVNFLKIAKADTKRGVCR